MHVRELSAQQASMGDDVNLMFAYGDPLSSERMTSHRIRPPANAFFSRHLAQQRFATAAMRSLVAAAIRPEIVHAHGDYSLAWAAAHIADRLGAGSVLTLHGSLSRGRTHRMLRRRAFARLDRIIAVSSEIREQVMALGVAGERISVISSGIHLSRYAVNRDARRHVRATLGISDDAVVLVSVGRLHVVKGFEYLIESVSLMAGEVPEIHLLIVGDGPQRASLESAARRIANVRILGEMNPRGVAEMLGAADIFALASIDLPGQAEGTPTSIMEAMAAGLPIVATRTGGIPALVQGADNMLVPPRDPSALANAIATLAKTKSLREQVGMANRSAIAARDWPMVATRVSHVYRSIDTDRRRTSHDE